MIVKKQTNKQMILLGVKFESSIPGGIEERANCEGVNTAAIQEVLDEQTKELSKG